MLRNGYTRRYIMQLDETARWRFCSAEPYGRAVRSAGLRQAYHSKGDRAPEEEELAVERVDVTELESSLSE